MTVVVPMAGRGSRFLEATHLNPEYQKPKPLINIKGKSMIQWAIESLPFVHLPRRPAKTKMRVSSTNLIFICRDDHEREFGITKALQELFTNLIKVILIDQITRGALETVLKAREYINTDDDVIVSDSDHYFNGIYLYRTILRKHQDTVGIIPVFQPPDSEIKWSYTLFNRRKIGIAVGEKDAELARRGAYANIGGYYFSNGKLLVREAEEMIREGDMYGSPGKQEFYVAPLYNRLIKKGMKVQVAITPAVWGLGTPKDVEYFEKNYKRLEA